MEHINLLDIPSITNFALTSEYKDLRNLNNILDLKSDMGLVVVKSKHKDVDGLNLNRLFRFIDRPPINTGDIIIDITNDNIMRYTELH